MHWADDIIILGLRPHGENHAIAEVFAHSHGRWRGMVHGARSKAKRAWLQPGNLARAEWRARTADQLGTLKLEPLAQTAATALHDSRALAVLQALLAELGLCAERAAHANLFDGARLVLEHLHAPDICPALLARFELSLLAELGYGLDLSRCALTGATQDLAWVSPKTGRAASRAAGAPWAEKLLPLPSFLLDAGNGEPSPAEVVQALQLTGHFLQQRLFAPRGRDLPAMRQRLPQTLQQDLQKGV